MPQRDPGVYLEDIEHYAAAAVRFTSGFSLAQYLADEKTRAAVERVLEVCGEAMSAGRSENPQLQINFTDPEKTIRFRRRLHWISMQPP
jgi:uncharacterized protein with HEPN domain